MIGSRLRLAPRRLPLGRDDAVRFLPWVVALTVYVAASAGIALVMVDDALRAAEDSVATRLTVQVPADASDARLQTVLAVLRQTSGVRAVSVLAPAEIGRLLEPWLGAPVPIDELPVPRLIDVSIDRGETLDLAKLRQQVTAVVADTRVDDHRPWLDRQRAVARPLRGLLAAAIGAALLAVVLLAVYAARTALAVRHSTIELLHLFGARDSDIARPFLIRSLRLGLLGGAIGAAAVLPTIVALDGAGDFIRLPAAIGAIGVGDWRLWAILGGVTAAAIIIATVSALATVLRRLRRLT